MNIFTKIWSKIKSPRKKTPTILQMEATECGAASLAMILAYFGRYEPLEVMREACGISRDGSKATLILKAARQFGLEAKGYRVLVESLDSLPTPMILFWNFEHFVVYEGHSKNGKYFYLNDPASGPVTVDRELFEKSYTGVAMTFAPGEHFEKTKKPEGVLRSMLPMLTGMKSYGISIVWAGLLMVLPGILVPSIMQFFADQILPGKQEWLIPLVLFLIATVVFQNLLAWLEALALRRGQLQLSVNNTLKTLNHMFSLSARFFMQRTNGDLQTRVNLNTVVAEKAFGTIADNIVKFFTAIFYLGMMVCFSPLLTLLIVVFLLLDVAFSIYFYKKRQILNQSLQMMEVKMLNNIVSGLSMIENLRSSGRENAVFTQWTGQMAETNKKEMNFQLSAVYANMLPSVLNSISNVIILCCGATLVMNGQLTLGGLLAFETLTASFSAPFLALLMSASELQVMKAEVDRINDVFHYQPDNMFKPDEENVRQFDFESLELKNVTFGYNPQLPPLLTDFSMKISAGQRIAFVGSSGSGKSTLAKLINGTLSPWQGEILLNGKPYSEYTRSEFYNTVGTVDQNIILFSGSVGQNLTLFAPQYDVEALHDALKDACIRNELIARGPVLEQKIAEEGRNFSGGQRQRLEISRVLTYKTPLLILDEATSALDPLTEIEIDKAVRRRGCACIVVAHRLSTVRECDEIIMLDKGQVVERGTHDELMALNGKYAQLMKLEQNNG